MNEALPSFTAFMGMVRIKAFEHTERIGVSLLFSASIQLGRRIHEHVARTDNQ